MHVLCVTSKLRRWGLQGEGRPPQAAETCGRHALKIPFTFTEIGVKRDDPGAECVTRWRKEELP